MYKDSILALKKSNRFRKRNLFDNYLDFASNDYLGFAEDKKLLKKSYKLLKELPYHSPKASQLVNGYSPVHKEFEENLAKYNGFESAVTVGSGFLANISLFESLVRKGDAIFVDSEFHASGILATKLIDAKVIFFNHNDIDDLKSKIDMTYYKRAFIAIEGIYSMSGDIAKKEFFELSQKEDIYMIVDEAHSSGVIGDSLLGIYDYYNIKPNHLDIKMGTLGKAYGSYGAYILASSEIIDFLVNRAKPIIYSTALSLFDVAYANFALLKLIKKSKILSKKIKKNQKMFNDIFGIQKDGLVFPIEIADNKKVIEIQKELLKLGYIVGAIRQPTVDKAIIRVIARANIDTQDLKNLLYEIKGMM
jgi:8-amino-7-oxononanoate synthase